MELGRGLEASLARLQAVQETKDSTIFTDMSGHRWPTEQPIFLELPGPSLPREQARAPGWPGPLGVLAAAPRHEWMGRDQLGEKHLPLFAMNYSRVSENII